MTPDRLRELIEKADVIKRTTPSLGEEMGRVVRANRELDQTMRLLAPLLLELWEAAIRKAEDGPIGPPYDIDLALDALEEA